MADNKKKTQAQYIKKPYLKGNIYDRSVIKSALATFGSLLLLMLAYLLLGMMMMFDNRLLNIVLNSFLLIACYLVFYSSGMLRGQTAVNQGEILYHRQETGRDFTAEELACCFHPLKGFVIGMLGTVPVFLLALVFAFVTKRQMTSMGALPSWISGMTTHEEITAPLAIYTMNAGFGVTDFLRIFVRMNVMPFVNILGSADMDAMFLLERIAPVLVLIPGLCYGIGYTQGEKARARVHGDIAKGKKKQAKKAKREKQRRLQLKEPQKLN